MLLGSPKLKLALTDIVGMVEVALWFGASVGFTKLLELLSHHNFGEYQVIAAGLINVLAYGAKLLFSDTRVEIIEEDAGV
ncbi:hypothetical protein KW797_01430 [Candidatus Parcubacteria bacterium]|nr:hypothetical protein [Candidatus Parcubacteria bacterium]